MPSESGCSSEGQSTHPFKCTWEDCTYSFATAEELVSHWQIERSHIWCEECDEPYGSWWQFYCHKIESDRHIVCERCDKDFESLGGLERHIHQEHRVVSRLRCSGCAGHFAGPANFISHFLKNKCFTYRSVPSRTRKHKTRKEKVYGITRADFERCLQESAIRDRQEHNENPSALSRAFRMTSLFVKSKAPTKPAKGSQPQPAAKPVTEPTTKPVTEPATKPPSPKARNYPSDICYYSETRLAHVCKSNQEAYDRTTQIFGQPNAPANPPALPAKFNNISVEGDRYAPFANITVTTTVQAAPTEASMESYDEQFPPIQSIEKEEPIMTKRKIRSSSSTDSDFHGHASKANRSGDYASSSTSSDDEAIRTNIARNAPTEGWSAEHFRHPNSKLYYCSRLGCRESIANPEVFRAHYFSWHEPQSYDCPRCCRWFDSLVQLIAHVSSPAGKCKISEGHDFDDFIFAVTGGFVSASKGKGHQRTYSVVDHPDKKEKEEKKKPADSPPKSFW